MAETPAPAKPASQPSRKATWLVLAAVGIFVLISALALGLGLGLGLRRGHTTPEGGPCPTPPNLVLPPGMRSINSSAVAIMGTPAAHNNSNGDYAVEPQFLNDTAGVSSYGVDNTTNEMWGLVNGTRVVTRPLPLDDSIEITTASVVMSLRAAGFIPAKDVIEVCKRVVGGATQAYMYNAFVRVQQTAGCEEAAAQGSNDTAQLHISSLSQQFIVDCTLYTGGVCYVTEILSTRPATPSSRPTRLFPAVGGALATYNLAKRVVSAFSNVMYYGYQMGLIDYKCERATNWWQTMISTITGWNCFAPVKQSAGTAAASGLVNGTSLTNTSFVLNLTNNLSSNSSGMDAGSGPSSSSSSSSGGGGGGGVVQAVTQAWSSFTNWLFGR